MAGVRGSVDVWLCDRVGVCYRVGVCGRGRACGHKWPACAMFAEAFIRTSRWTLGRESFFSLHVSKKKGTREKKSEELLMIY